VGEDEHAIAPFERIALEKDLGVAFLPLEPEELRLLTDNVLPHRGVVGGRTDEASMAGKISRTDK
jgi:hypothetical protein